MTTYVGYDQYNSIQTDNKMGFLLVDPNENTSTKNIYYGDACSFKTMNDTWLTFSSGNNDIIIENNESTYAKFILYDKYGQGKEINWARRSKTEQSSTFKDNYSTNAILPNDFLYSSTNEEIEPWFLLTLPLYISIENISVLFNNIANEFQLYELFILDEQQNKIYTLIKSGTDIIKEGNKLDLKIPNISGKHIKISMKNKSSLQIKKIKLYGQPLEHSVLLEKPQSRDLIDYKYIDKQLVFNQIDLPLVKNDLSIAFYFKISNGTTKLLTKGDVKLEINNYKLNYNGREIMYEIEPNKYNHLILFIQNSVNNNISSDWIYVKYLNKFYFLNKKLKEMRPAVVNNTNIPIVITPDEFKTNGYVILKTSSHSSLTSIYINNELVFNTSLKLNFQNSLIIHPGNHIKDFKFANYISKNINNYISNTSNLKQNVLLLSDIKTNTSSVYSAVDLPRINNIYSFNMWFKIIDAGDIITIGTHKLYVDKLGHLFLSYDSVVVQITTTTGLIFNQWYNYNEYYTMLP
jgi:hypothetical protein